MMASCRTASAIRRQVAAPSGSPSVRELVPGARGGLLLGLIAIAPEHQGRGAPDIDFRYHGRRLSPISGATEPNPFNGCSSFFRLRFVHMKQTTIQLTPGHLEASRASVLSDKRDLALGFFRRPAIRLGAGAAHQHRPLGVAQAVSLPDGPDALLVADDP